MASNDQTLKSLRAVVNDPMMFLAELAWRWAFAVGAIGILLHYSSILRDAISLSAADQNVLLNGDILQVISTGSRVLAGSLPFFVQTAVTAVPLIALLWWICATVGRVTVLRRIASLTSAAPQNFGRACWTAMAVVHGVRVLLFLIVISSYIAAGRLAAVVMGDIEHPRIFSAFVVFLFVFGFGLTLWALTNFMAALAPLFVVARARAALDSLADAVKSSIRDRGRFFAAASTNAMLRTVFSVVITGAGILLLPLSGYLPTPAITILAALLTVVYCLGSDLLLLARTTAYAWISLGDGTSAPFAVQRAQESPLYSAPPDLRS